MGRPRSVRKTNIGGSITHLSKAQPGDFRMGHKPSSDRVRPMSASKTAESGLAGWLRVTAAANAFPAA